MDLVTFLTFLAIFNLSSHSPPPILSGCLLSEKTVWRNDPGIVVRHVNFSVNFRISLLVAILVCTRLIS